MRMHQYIVMSADKNENISWEESIYTTLNRNHIDFYSYCRYSGGSQVKANEIFAEECRTPRTDVCLYVNSKKAITNESLKNYN